MKVIGISGRAGSGKDFIYNNYFKPRHYYRWALADHFKVWIVGRGEASHEEVFYTKPPRVRKLLQEEGTERGRNVYGDNVWCRTAAEWFRVLNEQWSIEKFIITDIRFPNEVEFIRGLGGRVLRIVAPQRESLSGLTEEARKHISETALDDFTRFDGMIYNDPSDEDITVQLNRLLNDYDVDL